MSNLPDQLGSNETLAPGGSKISNGGIVKLTLHPDGNLVLKNVQTHNTLWQSNTSGHQGASLAMSDNGTLALLDATGAPVWTVGPGNVKGAHLVIQDDGNLVVYKDNQVDPKHAVWSTATNGQAGTPSHHQGFGQPPMAYAPPNQAQQFGPQQQPQWQPPYVHPGYPPYHPQQQYPQQQGGYDPYRSRQTRHDANGPYQRTYQPGYNGEFGSEIPKDTKAAGAVGAVVGLGAAMLGAPVAGAIALGAASALAAFKLLGGKIGNK